MPKLTIWGVCVYVCVNFFVALVDISVAIL